MLNSEIIENIGENLIKFIKESKEQTEAAIKQGINAILTETFSKVELVTREEFDVQAKVLARTRAKLDDLADKLAKIEKAIPTPHKD
ncbi:MAG: hypothetical protein A3F18_07485 [Legionellales bacterium RIFCSPHIGHO2_12_FULL_37_14]|nr:MAG: hypothetical protein A3F18_07485 [Legionellales bacterium RIFCSPHIGHO2_12_FULL_37_14]